MLFPVFFTLMLMIVPFDNVFGAKDILDYESFKMLRKFDKKILQPLIEFCSEEKSGENVEKIDNKNLPQWLLCAPVNSLDEAFTNIVNGMQQGKLYKLKFQQDEHTIRDWLVRNKQEKWNKLKTLYKTFLDKFHEVIVVQMTKDYIYDYSSDIIGKEKLENLNIHREKTLKKLEKPDLKKRFVSKMEALKEEKELEKSIEIINQIREIALVFDKRLKDDLEEVEFLLQVFVANLSFCAKNLPDKQLQEIADAWPIWETS